MLGFATQLVLFYRNTIKKGRGRGRGGGRLVYPGTGTNCVMW